jgi:hypothetical protein
MGRAGWSMRLTPEAVSALVAQLEKEFRTIEDNWTLNGEIRDGVLSWQFPAASVSVVEIPV